MACDYALLFMIAGMGTKKLNNSRETTRCSTVNKKDVLSQGTTLRDAGHLYRKVELNFG